ncbi:MAG: glycolate oxidase subunit GlcE [Burkholderiales bacterium]|nr:glycolate oxidase subunit GlcE [Burkholderiales bacterium]
MDALPATSSPALAALVERVQAARASKTPLEIRGGRTKAFYGEEPRGEPLEVASLTGISSYEPSELVVTVRAGTPLAELEAVLAAQGQCLPFEPPRFAAGGSVGGMVAAGLAGPARAAVGGVRDYLLGATLLDGRGELLSFGGRVMKNVAGYDVSRVLAGSMGTLGLICEVSLKVLPRPRAVLTLRLETDPAGAIRRFNEWAGQPLPIDATAWWDGMAVLRLAGAEAAVGAAAQKIGGEVVEDALAVAFWTGLRDHRDEFFVGAGKAVAAGAALWRLSVPATTAPLKLSGEQLVEWGGAQRWLCTSAPAAVMREAAAAAGGHAVLFRGRDKSAGAFAPLKPVQFKIQRELKRAFDPDAIFNPGRLTPGI